MKQPVLEWLMDPEVFQINREKAHSDHVAYSSLEEVNKGQTSLRQSLNGKWQFQFSETIAEAPEEFYKDNYVLDDFETIEVPGHIELQGYGQIQYINTLYPWDGRSKILPPKIDPDRTTVGSYVRTFNLDKNLQGKKIYISFQGVDKAFMVWLNGHFIGYSEDSFTPSEFKLSPYIKDKDNKLSVQVFQNSSASWIEDQDMFRFSGIFRDVYLYAKPEVHIDDIWFKTSVDQTIGKLVIRLKIDSKTKDYMLDIEIKDPDNKVIISQNLPIVAKGNSFETDTFNIPEVKLWSHESPNLYSVLLTVRNSQGEVIEVIPYKIGFRNLVLEDGIIKLNGDRLFIKGVNRHEWNPNKGRAIDKSDMDNDMDIIIKNNINAVRTSHYPNQSYWYDLCDENGIYLIDETNLESHGSWQKLMKVEPSWNVPGDLPEWRENVLDRAQSMFERDKNHPSILFWSVGNESYAGSNLMAMADYFREQDNSRLVHYEGSYHNREWDDISDVESQMYAPPESIREYLENNPRKPFILCEFMHDMGNSLGGLQTYMDLGDEFDQYQGGFIWDFKDQALWRKDKDGTAFLGYGGDFGERQSDYNFSGNGIVFADSKEKPAIQEVKYWYAPKEQRKNIDKANKEVQKQYKEEIDQLLQDYLKSKKETLKVIKGDGAVGIQGKNFEILFSKPEGGPSSLKKGKQEWIWRAPKPAFWRAPTENDIGNQYSKKSAIWQAIENSQIAQPLEIKQENNEEVEVSYNYTSPILEGYKAKVSYHVFPSGTIRLDMKVEFPEGTPQPALIGLRFQTFEKVESYSWVGIENETYPDRKQGKYGKFTQIPETGDYLFPQEYGNHTDTLFVLLEDKQHNKLEFIYCNEPFNFSVVPHTPGQLQEAYHQHELPKSYRSVITINGFMRGVGGIDSWGSDVEEQVQLKENTYEFSFYLK